MAVDVSTTNAVSEPSAVSISSGLLVSAWINLDALPSDDSSSVAVSPAAFEWIAFAVRTNFSTGDTLLRITNDSGGGFDDWFVDVTLGSLTGAWHHFLWHLPLSGSTNTDAQIWVDGTLQSATWDSGTGSWTISAITGGEVAIGGNPGFGFAVDGQLAEVGIWDTATAPSSSEISDLSDGTGATRPGDLSSLSASLVFYAPLESDYVLDTPTGTLSDIGTGSTSIVGAHPTMASAGPQIVDTNDATSSAVAEGADLAVAGLTLDAGEASGSAVAEGADVTLAASLALDAGDATSSAVAEGADLTIGAVVVDAGDATSSAVAEGADLTLAGTTIDTGDATGSAVAEGADVAVAAALTLDAGDATSSAVAEGADVTLEVPGTLTVDAADAASSAVAEGADLTLGVAATLDAGETVSSAVAEGPDLTQGVTITLAAGEASSSAVAEGASIRVGDVVLLVLRSQALTAGGPVSGSVTAGGPVSGSVSAGGPVSSRLEVRA